MLTASMPRTAGELNYKITMTALEYLEMARRLRNQDKPSYSDFNEVIGALECAKLELYRRMIAPYEEQKRFENGDVYE